MLRLKNRIERVENRNGLADSETKLEFGGHLLLQDFELIENEDGEMVEVTKEGIRREYVMYPEYTPKPCERVLGFEPMTITQAEFNQVFKTVVNTSRSI